MNLAYFFTELRLLCFIDINKSKNNIPNYSSES